MSSFEMLCWSGLCTCSYHSCLHNYTTLVRTNQYVLYILLYIMLIKIHICTVQLFILFSPFIFTNMSCWQLCHQSAYTHHWNEKTGSAGNFLQNRFSDSFPFLFASTNSIHQLRNVISPVTSSILSMMARDSTRIPCFRISSPPF